MVFQLLVVPKRGGDGLGAYLLGLGDAGGLQLAVGVVAARADVDFAVLYHDDILHLAAGLGSDHGQVMLLGQDIVPALEDGGDFLGGGHP